MIKGSIKVSAVDFLICFLVLLGALICLMPFLLVISGSLTTEREIIGSGYKLIPRNIDFTAYKVLYSTAGVVLNGYKISIIVTVVGTGVGLMLSSMMAYPISQKRLKYRNVVSIFALITILFNGGIVSWFIVCRNILHLKDSYPALIVPYLVNAWNVFLLRNYFQTIPEEMAESAKMDGAGEMTIFIRIVLPVSKPVLAVIGLFISLGYWNDWWLGIMLIDKPRMQPLQLLLRTIVSNVQFLRNSEFAGNLPENIRALPSEGLKMATAVVTVGPIIFVYPFIQKYFVKGIMLGAVKG